MLNTAIIFHPFSLFVTGFSKLRLHFPAIQRTKEILEFERKPHKLLNGFWFFIMSPKPCNLKSIGGCWDSLLALKFGYMLEN